MIDEKKVFPHHEKRMYAIAFDLDIEILRATYGNPYNRLLSKLASVDEMQGAYGAEKSEHIDICDASSTGATQQVATEVEFRKKSNNAYSEVKNFLVAKGFEWQQGSIYFGNPARVNAVTCVVTINELSKAMPWFAASVRDIRMLRIEENNDLRPALEMGS